LHLAAYEGKGRDEAYLRKLARQRGLAERVVFRGHVGDIRSISRDSHLNIMASRSKGTSLALVEAMLCGRPSIVTDVGGNPEWVAEPRNGFGAEAATVRSFGAALERACTSRADWEAIGKAAHHDTLSLIDPAPAKTLPELVTAPALTKLADFAVNAPAATPSSEQLGQMTR
jgi:glycosyltransferase involved in cell wall biosynthesis